MALLYSYNGKELEQFISNETLIRIELKKYNIVFEKAEFFNLEKFVAYMFIKYNFVRYDIKQITSPIIKNEPHSHNNDEARMIIKGDGVFFFDIEDIHLQLEVVPGDFVVIPANLTHYFKTICPLTAIRFFSNFGEVI